MADEQTTQAAAAGSEQASGQSSSQSGSQQTSADASRSANTQSGQTQNSAGSQAAAKAERPAWAPETVWDGDKGSFKPEAETYFKELTAFKAAEDSRKLTLPTKPEELTLSLPADFKAPEGIEFVPNENDPILPQARAFALKHGLTKDAWSELLALHAAGQVSTTQTINNAKAAEVQKLGVNGTARKTAVDTYLIAELGEDLGKEMSKYTFTAKQIEGFEKLMAKVRTQGNGTFTPQHRDEQAPGKKTDAEISKMTFTERREYAAKFPQPALQANGR